MKKADLFSDEAKNKTPAVELTKEKAKKTAKEKPKKEKVNRRKQTFKTKNRRKGTIPFPASTPMRKRA